MRSKTPILVVEDDEVDAITIRRSLRDINVTNRIDITGDGEEALELLRDPTYVRPCLILLDLNMPRMSGLEFLRIVKHDAQLRRIPVVVLTTSTDDQDKIASFNLGVAGYMVKPVDYPQFVEVIRTIDMYWTLSELPKG